MSREWWDREAHEDTRYATRKWGGDGTRATVAPTMHSILTNISLICGMVEGRTFRRHLRVLEIGCGPGRLLHPLAAAFPDYSFHGIDVSPEMLALGDPWPANVTTYLAGEPLPGAFDVVYSVEVLQHLERHEVEAYLFMLGQHLLAVKGLALLQYVEGEDTGLPMNHPIITPEFNSLLDGAGLAWYPIHGLIQVHDEWRWVVVG